MTNQYARRTERRYDLLLIESRPTDASPFIESFEATDATETVHVVDDGDEALAYVRGDGEYADAPRPDLIILDLHDMESSGERLLGELDDHPELGPIPLLVFTSTATVDDVTRSYDRTVNAFLEKPETPTEFAALAQAIEDFWLTLAHLPPK